MKGGLLAEVRNAFTVLKSIRIIPITFIIVTPFVALYGLMTTQLVLNTCIFAAVSYVLAMIGINAGYHRMYSHNSFKAAMPVHFFLLFWATTALINSGVNYVRDHRYHHKYVDTDMDPYNAKRGFWFTHVGWMLYKRRRYNPDISDIMSNRLVALQHKYYHYVKLPVGIILPIWVCGHFWGDWRGGFYIATILKLVLIHHSQFSINSFAHWLGDATYQDTKTPRDSLLCAMITMGEGYHNYHHEFPSDYRHGIHWAALDPVKWFIGGLELLGLTYDLERMEPDRVKHSKLQMEIKRLEEQEKQIYKGKPLNELPFYTREQITELCSTGKKLAIVNDIVFDMHDFSQKHPGGAGYITNNNGRDITQFFNGGVYNHSNAARNLLQTMRCGKIAESNKGSCKEE